MLNELDGFLDRKRSIPVVFDFDIEENIVADEFEDIGEERNSCIGELTVAEPFAD